MIQKDTLYIGGEWVDSTGSERHRRDLARTPRRSSATVPDGHDGRHRRAPSPRPATPSTTATGPRMPPAERLDIVAALRRHLRRPHDGHGRRSSPTRWARPSRFSQLAQAPAPWMMLNTFLELGRSWHVGGEPHRACSARRCIVRSEAVGVVAAIVPWNVPQFVTMSKLAPALLSGCTIVIKPAPETPLDAFLMAELLEEAGVPDGRRQHRPRRPRGR